MKKTKLYNGILMDVKTLEEEKRLAALAEKERVMKLIDKYDGPKYPCIHGSPESGCVQCFVWGVLEEIRKSGPIRRNRAKCKLCQTVIESTHVHDFKSCKCGAMFVDGGNEYIRRGAKNFDDVEEMP